MDYAVGTEGRGSRTRKKREYLYTFFHFSRIAKQVSLPD